AGARTPTAQVGEGVLADVPVAPLDAQHALLGKASDLGRNGRARHAAPIVGHGGRLCKLDHHQDTKKTTLAGGRAATRCPFFLVPWCLGGEPCNFPPCRSRCAASSRRSVRRCWTCSPIG